MARANVAAALLAALSQEVQPFLRRVKARRVTEVSLPVWEFPLRAGPGVVVLSGVGQDAAARAAAFLIEHYHPQVFISLGFGGAVTPELPHGALVLGETLVAMATLVERLKAAGLPAYLGSVVTTPGIINKARQGRALSHLLHPVLDLETSAAVTSLQAQNIPFLALRAVTDTSEEEIPDFISQAIREGKKPTASTALAWLTADPRRLANLLSLWRHSRLAGKHLAQALEVMLETV